MKRNCYALLFVVLLGGLGRPESSAQAPEKNGGSVTESARRKGSGPVVPPEVIEAVRQGRFAEALPAYQKNVEREPNNDEAHVHLSVILLGLGRNSEAVREANEAIRLNPLNASAHCELANVLLKQRKYDAAILEYKEAVRLKPTEAKYEKALGVGFALSGRPDDGIVHLQRAIQSDPKLHESYVDLGALYFGKGDYDAAVKTFAKSLEIHDSFAARFGKASALVRSGKFADAINFCDSVLLNYPAMSEAYAFRGYAKMRMGDVDGAIRDAEESLVPSNTVKYIPLSVLGCVKIKQGTEDEAIATLTDAIAAEPLLPLPLMLRAAAYASKSDFVNALQDIDAAIATVDNPQMLNYWLDGYGWQAYKFRGIANSFGRGDLKVAKDDYTKAIALNDIDADCFALRAWVECRLGEWDNATADLNKTVSISPNHRLGTHLLVQVLSSSPIERLRNGSRAVELASKACEHSTWKDASAIEALAGAYAETGDFEKAVLTQERATKMFRNGASQFEFETSVWWQNVTWKATFEIVPHDSEGMMQSYRERRREYLKPWPKTERTARAN